MNNKEFFERRTLLKEEMYRDVTRYSNYSDEIKRILFEYAYERGHASGKYEVESYFDELESLLDKIAPLLKSN